MSPRPQTRSTYRSPRDRREVAFAALGVLSVLLITAVLIWVFAPPGEDDSLPTNITIPTGLPTDPSATTLAPATTVSSTPG